MAAYAVGTTGQVGKVGVGGEVGQGPGTVRTQEGERGKGVEENVGGLGLHTGANMVAEPGSATHGEVATVGGHKGEEKAAEVWGEIDSLKDQQPAGEEGELMKMMKAMMSRLEKLDNKVDGLLGGQVGLKEVGIMEVGIDRKRVRKLEVEEEKEEEQQAVELTSEEAAEGSLMVKGKVDRWLGDRG